jgi:hypothetical protein
MVFYETLTKPTATPISSRRSLSIQTSVMCNGESSTIRIPIDTYTSPSKLHMLFVDPSAALPSSTCITVHSHPCDPIIDTVLDVQEASQNGPIGGPDQSDPQASKSNAKCGIDADPMESSWSNLDFFDNITVHSSGNEEKSPKVARKTKRPQTMIKAIQSPTSPADEILKRETKTSESVYRESPMRRLVRKISGLNLFTDTTKLNTWGDNKVDIRLLVPETEQSVPNNSKSRVHSPVKLFRKQLSCQQLRTTEVSAFDTSDCNLLTNDASSGTLRFKEQLSCQQLRTTEVSAIDSSYCNLLTDKTSSGTLEDKKVDGRLIVTEQPAPNNSKARIVSPVKQFRKQLSCRLLCMTDTSAVDSSNSYYSPSRSVTAKTLGPDDLSPQSLAAWKQNGPAKHHPKHLGFIRSPCKQTSERIRASPRWTTTATVNVRHDSKLMSEMSDAHTLQTQCDIRLAGL